MSDFIAAVTPTICRLLHIAPPALCTATPLPDVLHAAQAALQDRPVQRMLVYAPDAVGRHLLDRDPGAEAELKACAPVEVRLSSVMPSVTPVCFATMFTGGLPAEHGIQRYEKPRLECDTLFDALLRAGKRVAIVAVKRSSIDIIFRGRELDYFSEEYDAEVTTRAFELLARDSHDFILAYHQEYDDLLHRTQPFSPAGLAAFQRHCHSFSQLCAWAHKHWAGFDHAVAFTPDHGAHLDPSTGHGMHGMDLAADRDLSHYWSINAALTAT
jgi:hypothetical protein